MLSVSVLLHLLDSLRFPSWFGFHRKERFGLRLGNPFEVALLNDALRVASFVGHFWQIFEYCRPI